ncbi:pesticin C-terminus-like muramidase [Acinetobacter sp. SFB]|uniref:pesticin C-terminus-like muramidase n=1 Tax=Acinetobacter sp. SFB TaxID=1805634 RepID=UPI000AB15358|nr:pesticin C-terminus-like muramidase [Acinetobacter sp. SFB]
MSNLVTITSKFYDKSGRRIINLNVKSRYHGSTKENQQNTDKKGFFIFHASPNRTIEILAKPPNTSDYKVFKTISSSIVSSELNPIKVQLPKTIEEYKTGKVKQPANGIVITLFKVIDSKGKVMVNFPVQSRPKGKKAFERSTNKDGIVEIESSPNREIEILVLTSSDRFLLKKSVNSGNGSQQPILIKLDEPYDNFKSLFTITLLDRNDNNYIVEKTNVEILALESREKNIITTSNGKIVVRGHIGKWLRITVYKPDGTPLKSINYLPKIINESSVKLHLDVDVTNGITQQDEPVINKSINHKKCSSECIIQTYSFETSLGTMIISKESLESILKWEKYEFKPYVPSKGGDGRSGVTLGYGYDLGQQSIEQIKKDLALYYNPDQIQRLLKAQGKKGVSAQALVSSLSDITISKNKAYDMVMIVKKRYAKDTLKIYPDILKYHPHCQGAILSLVYNRYIGLKGNRRKEMREIQDDLKKSGSNVSISLRNMKRLWTTKQNRGLQARREDEAKIFEKGLKCDCYK